MKRWYDRTAKKDEVLIRVNEIRVPILRVAYRAKDVVSAYRRHESSVVHVDSSKDFRMWIIQFDLPATRKPVVYGFYISAQSWYICPKEAERRARRFWSWFRRRVPEHADVYVAFIAKRVTSGARSVLLKHGMPPRSPADVRKDIVNYFRLRIEGLRKALVGKRIFGELAILAWILSAVYAEFVGGKTADCYNLSNYVLRVALKDLPSGLPPPGDEYIDTLMRICVGG